MESHGFMQAAHQKQIPAIVLKGISDAGDAHKRALEKATGGFHRTYACSNSVVALIHLLRHRPRPPVPPGRRIQSRRPPRDARSRTGSEQEDPGERAVPAPHGRESSATGNHAIEPALQAIPESLVASARGKPGPRMASRIFDARPVTVQPSAAVPDQAGSVEDSARAARPGLIERRAQLLASELGDPTLRLIAEALWSTAPDRRPVLILGDTLDTYAAPGRHELAAMLSAEAGLEIPDLSTAAYRIEKATDESTLSAIATRALCSRTTRSTIYRDLLSLPFHTLVMVHPDAAFELEVVESPEPHRLIVSSDEGSSWPSSDTGRRVYLLAGSARRGERLCLRWSDEERLCNDLEQAIDLRYQLANRPIVLASCDLQSRVLQELMRWVGVHASLGDHPIFVLGEHEVPARWIRWGAIHTTLLHPVRAFAELSQPLRAARERGAADRPVLDGRELSARNHPYKFLDAYGPEDEALFFGRDDDGQRLRFNLWTSRDGLSVLSGQSGVGKTSLVRAWLLPRLERERGAITVYCRFGDDPRPAILASLRAALEKRGRVPQHPDLAFPEALAALTRAAPAEVLIAIDQLEEAIILRGEEGVRRFVEELRRFLGIRPSTARFLLVLRGDFLGWLAHFHSGVLESSVRLAELSRTAARQAVLEPAYAFALDIEEGFIDAVLDDLSPERILPANLQIVLDQMLRSSGAGRLDLETYRNRLGGASQILREHLNNVLSTMDLERARRVRIVLQAMVTSQQTNSARSSDELAQLTGLEPHVLTEILFEMVHRQRLVRELGHDGTRYELVHDSLAPSLVNWFEEHDRQGQVTRERLQRALDDGYGTVERPLEPDLLAHVARSRFTLALGPEAMRIVVLSWALRGATTDDWWDVVATWTPEERLSTLIASPLDAGPEALTQVLRGGVGQELHRLGRAIYADELRSALLRYLVQAPFDLVGRVIQLCFLDAGTEYPASVALLRELDRSTAMLQATTRRELLRAPLCVAETLARWIASGRFLGLDHAITPFDPARIAVSADHRDEALVLAPSRLAGPTQAVGPSYALCMTLPEPARRLIRLLRLRASGLGWRDIVSSFAWKLAIDVLEVLRSGQRKLATIACMGCGKANDSHLKFCVQCGHELQVNGCSRCGKPNAPHYRFCLGCGNELPAAPDPSSDMPAKQIADALSNAMFTALQVIQPIGEDEMELQSLYLFHRLKMLPRPQIPGSPPAVYTPSAIMAPLGARYTPSLAGPDLGLFGKDTGLREIGSQIPPGAREIGSQIPPGARVLVPGPNGLMQSATVRQLLQGYYELEVGHSDETI